MERKMVKLDRTGGSGFSYILLKYGTTLSVSFLKENIKENGTIKFYASWSKNSSSSYRTTTKKNSSSSKTKCSSALSYSVCRFCGYTWKNDIVTVINI